MKTSTVMVCSVLGVTFFLQGAVFADTVTIDPGNGVATNVQQRITGATDVVINSGATGGGIVTLNPYNTYTGSTTLGCGTLVATALGGGAGSSLGSTSGLTLGAGTFRYAGADGGSFAAPITSFASATNKCCVLDVQSDLVITNNWTQNYGTFIKTGPGTVTFRGKNNFFGGVASSTMTKTLDDRTHKLTFNDNGDGPTVGVRGGFILAEGAMVIEGDSSTTNYINNSEAYGAIGTWTADSGEQEKSAVLEIRGGYNVMTRASWLGYHNGTLASGGENVSSGIRMTGGYLRIGAPGLTDTVFVGGQTSPNGPQRSNPFIEVSGGTLDIGKNLQLGNQGGVNTRLAISGDGRLITGQYIGNGYTDGSKTTGPSTNSVTVSGNGYLETRYVHMFTRAGESQCDVSLLDNAVFAWTVTNNPAFSKDSSATGVMNVLIDGGTVSNSFKVTKAHDVAIFHTKTDRVAIGTRGATFVSDARNTAQYVFGLRVPFVATNTVEGMEQQPVNFLCGNDKKTTYRFYSTFNWPGSLRLGPFAYAYVEGNGGSKFATDGTFIHCRDARLISNVDSPVFKDYQIGEDGVMGGVSTVFLTSGTHVLVTNSFRVASDTSLYVYMRNSGASWTAGGAEFTTPGDYTILTVPASSRSELERLSVSYAYANKCTCYFFREDNGDGTVTLKLRIVSSGTPGTTTVSDFVDGAVLGSGTLDYVGAGEETTGFAINAPGAAVLKTTGALTVTEGVETRSGALVKIGAADLTLLGSGVYAFTGDGGEWSATASDNEIGENGESPSAGYKGLSVREGRVVVGRQPDDAPTVEVSSLSVGSNPAETDIPAELVVSNGVVAVAGEARLSPAVGKTNRIELSGGTLSVGGTFKPGNMSGMDTAAVTPGQIVVNDGGRLVLSSASNLYNGDMGEAELVINEGGTVSAWSNLISTKTSLPYRGTLRFNGGVYSYATPSEAPYLRYINIVVGEKGAIFDGEERFANGGVPTSHYLHIGGKWTKDPSLGDAPDGGIVFRGRALFYLGGTFVSSIEGPIVVQDRAQLESYGGGTVGLNVVVKPGCAIRTYQNSATTTMFKGLVLGEDGVAGPVRVEIRNNADARSIYSMVVSNEFSTLSPVCFAARSSYNALTQAINVGVYTAIVYRAACDANVDISKFYLSPEIANRTATFEKVDVVSGVYSGWKAVVATVASGTNAPDDMSKYPLWTATLAGGAWSAASNWADGIGPDAVGAAVFGAPAAADVPVNLDCRPSLELLRIMGSDAAKGYSFGGTGPLAIEGGSLVSGANVEVAGGAHEFAAPLHVGRDAKMDIAAGSVVTVQSKTGDGMLTLNSSDATTTGKTKFESVEGGIAGGYGRTEVRDLSFATKSGKLVLGSGTLAYTGAVAADEVHLALAPNRTDANAATVFENAATVRVTEVTGEKALVKTGTGTLVLGGTSAMPFKGTSSWANTATDLIDESGNAPVTCFRGLNVAQGTVVVGAANDAANAPVVTSDSVSVGLCCSPTNSGTTANLVMNNGTLSTSSHLLIGNFATQNKEVVNARYEQNGGTVNIGSGVYIGYAGSGSSSQAISGELAVNSGELNVVATLYASHGRRKFSGQTNRVSVNGGTLTVQDVIGVSYSQAAGDPAPSTIEVNGGEFNVNRNYTFAYRKDESHTLELNGGVFRLGGYMKATNTVATGVSAAVKFNGGEYRPQSAAPSIDTAVDMLVGEGGAIVSTEEVPGGVCTLAASLKHDAALGGAADGGLVKRGAGTLALSGVNAFTGRTVVEEGVLQALSDDALPTVTEVRYGATLDLGGASRTVGGLAGDGVVQNGTLVLAGPIVAGDGVPFLDCDLATVGGAAVDFGCTAENPVQNDKTFLVARISGTTVGGIRLRALNAGYPCGLRVTVEDGNVYVTTEMKGMTILIQ